MDVTYKIAGLRYKYVKLKELQTKIFTLTVSGWALKLKVRVFCPW